MKEKKNKKKNVKKQTLSKISEKTKEYTEYEEFHIEKELNRVFKFLMIFSIIISIIIIHNHVDICNDVIYAKCGTSYNIVHTNVFLIILWLENILAIVFCLYKIFCGIVDGKGKEVIIGIIFILIQPVVWENIFKMLNIIW